MNPPFIKDPNAVLDYSIDWQYWLSYGDTIANSEWFIADADLKNRLTTSALTIERESREASLTTVWLSGGDGVHYVVNRITTAEGRQDDRHIQIRVQHK